MREKSCQAICKIYIQIHHKFNSSSYKNRVPCSQYSQSSIEVKTSADKFDIERIAIQFFSLKSRLLERDWQEDWSLKFLFINFGEEGEININLFFYLFMQLFVDYFICPDWQLNLQPWTMFYPTELPGQGKNIYFEIVTFLLEGERNMMFNL